MEQTYALNLTIGSGRRVIAWPSPRSHIVQLTDIIAEAHQQVFNVLPVSACRADRLSLLDDELGFIMI
jgi:hypothetical protein